MKTYEQAIEGAARHQVHMEVSHCFDKNELGAAHMVRTATITDIYDKDYGDTEFRVRRAENWLRSHLDEWYKEYVDGFESEE